MSLKSRNWCYTLNNYTDEQYNTICLIECKYHVIGKEVGEKGTKHLQGYIEYVNAMSFDSVRTMLFNSHIEKRMGTRIQAAEYCKKEKQFVEFGKLIAQGERSDITEVMELIKAKEFIIDDHQKEYARYHILIDKLILKSYSPRTDPPEVH